MPSDADQTRDARKDERKPVVWPGTLTLDDDSLHDCQVVDVAFAGTLIETQAPIQKGDEVILTIAELGDFAASVKWAEDNAKGLLLLAGPDLLLKKFSEASGRDLSTKPVATRD